MATFGSCSDDSTPDKPTVAVPSGIQTVQVGTSKSFTINADFPGGYESHSIVAANGDVVENSSQPEKGAMNVQFDVSYTATNVGAGAITVTVTDQNGKTDTNTLALEVTP